MRGFKSIEQIQRFLSVHGPLQNLFRVGRSHLRAVHQRLLRDRVFASWRELTCVCWLKNRLASINLTVPRAGLTTEGELLALTLALTLTYPILKVLGYWIPTLFHSVSAACCERGILCTKDSVVSELFLGGSHS